MKDLNLTTKKGIVDFFKGEKSVAITEKTKVLYINETGESTAFKMYEGDTLFLSQVQQSEPEKELEFVHKTKTHSGKKK